VQLDQYYSGKGSSIVGYYQANEFAADNQMGPVSKKITEKIMKEFPKAVALVASQLTPSHLRANATPIATSSSDRSLPSSVAAARSRFGELIACWIFASVPAHGHLWHI
jgi:hypothetical protein